MRYVATAIFFIALAPLALSAQRPAPDHSLIVNALSAAPASIAQNAAVMSADGRTLRAGSNGWTCMPDDPTIPNNSPMCLDAVWHEFIDALMSKRASRATTIGIGYMLQGDMPVSNVDPYATGATSTNQWIQAGPPHVMIVVPDHASLGGLPTDPNNGGPWVMWKNTPYAHVMVPTRGNAP
jgi:hypothetical protein